MAGIYWDGYADEDTIVIDDFEPIELINPTSKQISLKEFLCIFDKYNDSRLPIKCSSVLIRASTFIISSNWDIAQWFPMHHQKNALMRRVNVIIEMPKAYQGGRPEMKIKKNWIPHDFIINEKQQRFFDYIGQPERGQELAPEIADIGDFKKKPKMPVMVDDVTKREP